MKAITSGFLVAILLCSTPRTSTADDPPHAAREVLAQFEAAISEIDKRFEAEAQTWGNRTAQELKRVQDQFCKEARLDEAVAIRDVIRELRAGTDGSPPSDLPPDAREIYDHHLAEVAEIRRKAEAEVQKWRDKTTEELKRLQDQFCREAKLDEAVMIRDLMRAIQGNVVNVLPDPGYVNNSTSDIGKRFYYEVTGVTTGGSVYGTDIFTTGSHLGMAAVHSGLLKDGQKGIVKVTVLPGQLGYAASTRNGVTSSAYGRYSVSFKVERVYGYFGKVPSSRAEGSSKPKRPPAHIK